MIYWSWQEMVAHLSDESMHVVVNGPDGRSGGLIGCSFLVRPNSYDHSRHHQRKDATQRGLRVANGTKLPVWDFVLHRVDGTGIRLHPGWSNNKVGAYDVEGHGQEVEPPWAGKEEEFPQLRKRSSLHPHSKKIRRSRMHPQLRWKICE